MVAVMRAITWSLRDAMRARMLAILFLPGLAAFLLWSALGWIYWDAWTGWVGDMLTATAPGRWLAGWSGGSWVVWSASGLIVIATIAGVMFMTAMVITEFAAMPLIIAFVARHHYPALEEKAGATWYGSLANTVVGIVQFVLLWIITLPLWFTGIGALILPALNSAYLNQRLFRYEALAEHASAAEYRLLRQRSGGRFFLLGLLLALVYYVPLLNLVAPVLTGLAFTHLGLAELQQLRGKTAPVRPAGGTR